MISRQLPEPLGDGRPRITVTRCSAWRRWRESRCLCDSEVELMEARQIGGSPNYKSKGDKSKTVSHQTMNHMNAHITPLTVAVQVYIASQLGPCFFLPWAEHSRHCSPCVLRSGSLCLERRRRWTGSGPRRTASETPSPPPCTAARTPSAAFLAHWPKAKPFF